MVRLSSATPSTAHNLNDHGIDLLINGDPSACKVRDRAERASLVESGETIDYYRRNTAASRTLRYPLLRYSTPRHSHSIVQISPKHLILFVLLLLFGATGRLRARHLVRILKSLMKSA